MPICVLSLENSEALKNPNGVTVVRCSHGSILVYSAIYFFTRRSSAAFQCLLPVSLALIMTFGYSLSAERLHLN